jgi:hypothetical protein
VEILAKVVCKEIVTTLIRRYVVLLNSLEYRRSDLIVALWNLRHRLKSYDNPRVSDGNL